MRKFDNFQSNLRVLEQAGGEDLENEFIISGIIDKFNLQFELGWKVLKELLLYEGKSVGNSGSPREIIKSAYTVFDFINEEEWLFMLKDRNDISHIYNGNAAKTLLESILSRYIGAFQRMEQGILCQYPKE